MIYCAARLHLRDTQPANRRLCRHISPSVIHWQQWQEFIRLRLSSSCHPRRQHYSFWWDVIFVDFWATPRSPAAVESTVNDGETESRSSHGSKSLEFDAKVQIVGFVFFVFLQLSPEHNVRTFCLLKHHYCSVAPLLHRDQWASARAPLILEVQSKQFLVDILGQVQHLQRPLLLIFNRHPGAKRSFFFRTKYKKKRLLCLEDDLTNYISILIELFNQ